MLQAWIVGLCMGLHCSSLGFASSGLEEQRCSAGFSQHLLTLGYAWPCQAAFLWLFWPELSSSKVEGYGCRLPHICSEHIMCLMQKTNNFGAVSWVSSSSGQGYALILARLLLLRGINTQVLYYPQFHVTDYANYTPVSLHLASNLHGSMNIRW